MGHVCQLVGEGIAREGCVVTGGGLGPGLTPQHEAYLSRLRTHVRTIPREGDIEGVYAQALQARSCAVCEPESHRVVPKTLAIVSFFAVGAIVGCGGVHATFFPFAAEGPKKEKAYIPKEVCSPHSTKVR